MKNYIRERDMGEEDDDHIVKKRISSDYIIDMNTFCDNDKDIYICKRSLDCEVFKHTWNVGWYKGDKEIQKLPLLNENFFKEALKKFYLRAHDQLQRFGFVGYYYIKDMAAWMMSINKKKKAIHHNKRKKNEMDEETEQDESGDEESEEDESDEDSDDEGRRPLKENILNDFPFGVITLGYEEGDAYGHFFLKTNKKTLTKKVIFECSDDALKEKYNFKVFESNQGPRFAKADDSVFNPGNDHIPVSPFFDLWEQKELLKEAELSLFDANSMIVYPEGYIIAKPQPDAKIEDIEMDDLFGVDAVIGAKQAGNVRREGLALENARAIQRRLQSNRSVVAMENGIKCGGNVAYRQSIFYERKLAFNRPCVNESLQYIPQSVEIPNVKSSAPIIPIEDRTRRYEHDICSIMNLPYSFFKPHSSTHSHSTSSGSKSNSGAATTLAQNEAYQRLLETEVASQQELFDTLFKDVYLHTFNRLNLTLFKISGKKKPAFYDEIEVGVRFENIVVKSDEAINNLLQFYNAGIIDAKHIRKLIYKNYDINEDPAKEPRNTPKTEKDSQEKKGTNKRKRALSSEDNDDEDEKKGEGNKQKKQKKKEKNADKKSTKSDDDDSDNDDDKKEKEKEKENKQKKQKKKDKENDKKK